MHGKENERFEERGKGSSGEKGGTLGDLSKAETIKAEILKRGEAPEPDLAKSGDFTVVFIRRERRSPDRLSKIFLQRFFGLDHRRDAKYCHLR